METERPRDAIWRLEIDLQIFGYPEIGLEKAAVILSRAMVVPVQFELVHF